VWGAGGGDELFEGADELFEVMSEHGDSRLHFRPPKSAAVHAAEVPVLFRISEAGFHRLPSQFVEFPGCGWADENVGVWVGGAKIGISKLLRNFILGVSFNQ